MKYRFQDLVDIQALQELTDDLYRATGIPSAVITMDGEMLTGSGWQRICLEFHRQHPRTLKECIESDTRIREGLEAGEKFVLYECPRGLVDASSPVVIDGVHMANVFSGQLFLSPPDEAKIAFFREQARRFGFDEDDYLRAVREVRIFTPERFRAALRFLSRLAELVAGMGLTRKKELEAVEELLRNERRYRRLLESTNTVPWELDVESGRFTYMGPQIETLLGYPPGSWKDLETWAERVHPEDREATLSFCRERTRRGEDHDIEYRMLTREGAVRWIQDVITVSEDPDGRTRLVGFMRDVTEAREAEQEKRKLREQLFQAQKMESVGRLAAGVAHDFNNYLSSITGYSQLARMFDLPRETLDSYLEMIEAAGDKCALLTQKLLAFSRKQVLEMRVVDMNRLLENLLKLLERVIGEDIVCELHPAPALRLIRADPVQIDQVMMNLAVNARDAMPEGGRLIIETANVDIDEAYAAGRARVRPGPHIVVSVTDTGQGMSPEVQSRIFDPFFSTKERDKGTGLGLSTVQGIVEQHSGWVNVYSEKGRGTTFKLYFPATSQTEAEDDALRAPEELRRGSERILVVDDNPSVRRLILDTLGPLGYELTEAENGREALAACEAAEGGPDLLITDVVMPGMNGRELAEEVRRRHPGCAVLFMSGFTDNVIAHHGILEPDVLLLQKPVTPTMLSLKIRQALDGRG